MQRLRGNPYRRTLVMVAVAFSAVTCGLDPGPVMPEGGSIVEVLPGDPSIDASVLRAHRAVYAMVKEGKTIGTMTRDVHATVGSGGQPALGTLIQLDIGNKTTIDWMASDPAGLGLLQRFFPAMGAGSYVVSFVDGRKLRGSLTPLRGGDPTPLEGTLETPVFEISQIDLVLAALPLAEGYRVKLPYARTLKGTSAWAVASVLGREKKSTSKGKEHDAWVVKVEFPKQGVKPRSFWIIKEPPYRIYGESESSSGVTSWVLQQ